MKYPDIKKWMEAKWNQQGCDWPLKPAQWDKDLWLDKISPKEITKRTETGTKQASKRA